MTALVIIQGTTPTYVINVGFDTETLQAAQIVFSQSGEQILKKRGLILSGQTVTLTLTQEDTFRFCAGKSAECQLRIKTAEGQVKASYPVKAQVYRSLDREVL